MCVGVCVSVCVVVCLRVCTYVCMFVCVCLCLCVKVLLTKAYSTVKVYCQKLYKYPTCTEMVVMVSENIHTITYWGQYVLMCFKTHYKSEASYVGGRNKHQFVLITRLEEVSYHDINDKSSMTTC